MKLSISIFILATILSSCGNSDSANAAEQAKKVESAIKENIPGTVATSAEGYTMKAKINGKDWEASSMMPPEAAARIIAYYSGEYIGLPYSKGYMVAGGKITFGEDNAVDLSIKDATGLWSCKNGEMQIMKVDDKWVEGKFFFSGGYAGSNKTMEVTEGFFRIPVAKP
jgi:hypothetical protein